MNTSACCDYNRTSCGASFSMRFLEQVTFFLLPPTHLAYDIDVLVLVDASTLMLPPLEFDYSQATIQEKIEEIDAMSLENMPYGLDGARYQ
jgi:hypothetical protein